jgi:hypothetical protein|tara:strand:+ start:245 stop:433 length:189 start_codon:yes stop_codon:yes gene_type:complete
MTSNPLDAAFAARIRNSKSSKMSAKRSWQILKEQQLEELKNVTPTKFNGCVNMEKIGNAKTN